ncbi:TolC family protein [Pontibacter populi]|uniref:TolC family protein n=1 Tax=Pontibacter populi TaxID=890055 RepID=A0ABV1RXN7_9BACT
MRKKILYFVVMLLLQGKLLHAQEVRPIAKEEVLTKVVEQNRGIKISQQEYQKSLADYRQTNAVFLPNITLSHTGYTTTNPLMAFGSKLNQEIISPLDFDPNALNNPERVTNFATKVAVEQPLLNLDGIYQRKAAGQRPE